MADFLTAVSTKKINSTKPLIEQVDSSNIHEDAVSIDSAETALKALKNQPSRTTVNKVLNYLAAEGFSLLLPDPLNASIAHQLVSDTIPNYWRSIKGLKESKQLERILRNPTSLGHIITRLRSLIVDSRQRKGPGEARNTAEHIVDALEVLDLILRGNDTSSLVLQDVLLFGKNVIQKKLIWKEYLAQAASGRLLSIAAEAEDVLKKSDDAPEIANWVADGKRYAEWLGRNIAVLLERSSESENHLSATVELCSKALGLGYTGKLFTHLFIHAYKLDHIMQSLLSTLIDGGGVEHLERLLSHMKAFEQRKYMNSIIAFFAKKYFSTEVVSKEDTPITSSTIVDAAAGLLYALIKDNDVLKEHLVSSLTRSTIPVLDDSLSTRRSVVAALTKDQGKQE